jgi:hypothetical protein
MKKIIKLTESDLTIIVNRVINESSDEDKRYERIADKFVTTYYSDIKYRKQGSTIHVYRGKTLRKQYRNDHKPNTIMQYSEMDGRLIIFRTELKSFDVILPMFQNDIIMIKYFIKSMTKLFVNKFGITPNYVVIDDKMIMDKVRSIPNT